MNDLQELSRRFHVLSGKKEKCEQELISLECEIDECESKLDSINKASVVIRELVRQARSEFGDEVNTLVTLVVTSIFSENFRFELDMATEGGRLQCTPKIIETIDGIESEYTPKDDMGGSVLDSIGFALRVIFHKFQKHRTRPLFLLDEPAKFTGHGELLTNTGKMLAELSHSLGLQIVVITHEPELVRNGDISYSISRKQGISTAEKLSDYADFF